MTGERLLLDTNAIIQLLAGNAEFTLIPDFQTGQWQICSLSVAAARGAARSELFRASPRQDSAR